MKKFKKWMPIMLMAIAVVIGTVLYSIWGSDKLQSVEEKNKTLSMYIENEAGEYVISNDKKFPTDGYVLDHAECKNGGTVTQDPTTKKISASVSVSDSCNLYFSKKNEKHMMMAYPGDVGLWAHKSHITTITFENTLSPKEEAEYTYDISQEQDESVMAYLIPIYGESSIFNVYIQSNGIIQAPEDSSNLFNEFSSLGSISGIEYFDTSAVTNMRFMFGSCAQIYSLDLINLNTSNVTNMYGMFVNCGSLVSLNLSNFDTSNVTDMTDMFSGCTSLTSLDLSNFNTSNVTEMAGMFTNCGNLVSLNLSNFDTSNVTNMCGMFFGCSSLTSLDLSNFNTSNVTGMTDMFSGCSSLTSLDLSNFNTSNVTEMVGMFANCSNLTTTIVINVVNTVNILVFENMFEGAATNPEAQITVNFTEVGSDLVDEMIATKSDNSNVVKGSLVA